MRIFQLNTFCGIKSTGRITTEIAKLVEADGGVCEIGYGAGQVPPELEHFAFRLGTPMERKLHGAARKLLDGEGYGSARATEKLIEELQRFRPDLLHFHNLHGCYLNLKKLFDYLQKTQLPVLWTLHDCWPFTGHCAYFDYADCQRWQTGCYSCPQQKSYPVCIGLDGSRRNYAMKKRLFTSLSNLTFAVPCQWMQQPLERSFLAHYPVKVIYNGVDVSTFHPVPSNIKERYGLQEQKLVLAVASDWDARKGLSYLLEASDKLGDGYRFAVIGLTGEQVQALPGNVIGIEHTSDVAELVAWYSAADCLANPTLEDNMPMVNLEALACGTPVAVFRTGGCPEAVDDTCGRVVEKGDVDGLCHAIAQLCPQKESMSAACLEQARRFDSKETFEAYLAMYKELCS